MVVRGTRLLAEGKPGCVLSVSLSLRSTGSEGEERACRSRCVWTRRDASRRREERREERKEERGRGARIRATLTGLDQWEAHLLPGRRSGEKNKIQREQHAPLVMLLVLINVEAWRQK